MRAIEVSGLKKSFKWKGNAIKAVDNVYFSVEEGEIFGLLGQNGAGKSTIINILAGTLEADEGDIRILGKNPKEEHEYVRQKMNVASAYFGLPEQLTLYENLIVYAKIYNVKRPKERVMHLLELFQLMDIKDKMTSRISSGERTRLNLCKALINRPKIILLDEATVGLEPEIASLTRKVIKTYCKQENASILFTSHYMYEVEELCDKIGFLKTGKLIKIDTAENLKKLIKKQVIKLSFAQPYKEIRQLVKDKKLNVIHIEDNAIHFEVMLGEQYLHQLIHDLYKNNIKIADIHIEKPTLNDIFIKIARDEI